MSPWSNCLLVALVLPKYVHESVFDTDLFLEDVEEAVYFADAVSRANTHPFEEQREMDEYSRRIGIEVTGLADMLEAMNLRYSSKQARIFVESLFRLKAINEIAASCKIAKENGCVPALKEKISKFLESPYIKRLELPEEIIPEIQKYGLAHTAFNTVGPCGSISIMAGNCTSGIEPLFAKEYTRKTSTDEYKVIHNSNAEVAHEIAYIDRILMQSVIQTYIDASISSTINLPSTATVEDVENIYLQAWEYGLKGVTVFRDGCREGVLNKQHSTPTMLYERTLLDLETAERHMVKYKNSKVYIIVSLDEDNAPVEVFAKLPRQAGINGRNFFDQDLYNEQVANWDGICRLSSKLLRYNIPLKEVVAQLKKSSSAMVDAPGLIARVLDKYVYSIEVCPQCEGNNYIHEGGCDKCNDCGYTTCG
jgi:ribonucleoside-diphosphate reductase alpha chain